MATAKKKMAVSKSRLKSAVAPKESESLKVAVARAAEGGVDGSAVANQWLENKAAGKRSKRNLAKRIHRPKANSGASKTGNKSGKAKKKG